MNIFISKQIIKYLEKKKVKENGLNFFNKLSKYSLNEVYDLNTFGIKEISDVPIIDFDGGSRIYCVLVKNNSSIYKRLEKFINPEEDTIILIELHSASEHDKQKKIVDKLLSNKLFSYEEAENISENDISRELFYFSKGNANFETSLLTLEQQKIFDKESKEKPILIRGIAGSGKTEVGIQYLEMLIQKEKNSDKKSKILYITRNKNLLDTIEKRIKKYGKTDNVYFHTIETFINDIREKESLSEKYFKFDTINNFITFKTNIIYKKIKKFFNNYKKICSIFTKYDDYILYSEIYGLIYGSMLSEVQRDIENENRQISRENYLNNRAIIQDYSIIDVEDKELVYSISEEYLNYLNQQKEPIYNSNEKSLQIIKYLKNHKYDKVIADEIQDLTECEIFMLLNCINNVNGIIFSGDINQVINPTFFKSGRIGTLLYQKFNYSRNLIFLGMKIKK